jgi:hypothetical protein
VIRMIIAKIIKVMRHETIAGHDAQHIGAS